MAKKGEEYTCAMCKGVFDRTMDDDEAFEETKELFPNSVEQGDPMDIICDDCWNKLPLSKMSNIDKARNMTYIDFFAMRLKEEYEKSKNIERN